jgi:hypothetical protein
MNNNEHNENHQGSNRYKKIAFIVFFLVFFGGLDLYLQSNGIYVQVLRQLESDYPILTKFKHRDLINLGDVAEGGSISEGNQNLFLDYEFVNNIVSVIYTGKWSNVDERLGFEHTNGKVEMQILKNLTSYNYITNLETENSLFFYFEINDGPYRDLSLNLNFSIPLPKNFSNEIVDNKGSVNIAHKDVKVYYSVVELYDLLNTTECNAATVELEFIADEKMFTRGYDYSNKVKYSKLKGRISDESCQFNLDFNLKVDDTYVYN